MLTCPNCKFEIESEKYYFCPNCENQIKCKKCGEQLVATKSRCLVCGERIVDYEEINKLQNRYSFEEKVDSEASFRKIELSFSDSSIEKAIPLFNPSLPLPIIKNFNQNTGNNFVLPPVKPEESNSEDKKTNLKTNENNYSDKLSLKTLFVRDEEDYLISRFTDYKGSSRKQQQERLCLLYVWGYFNEFGKNIGKPILIEGVKRNGLYDTNFGTYFNNVEQFLIKTNDTYRLNPAGQSKIIQILNEMQDEEIKGYIYWENSKPRAKRSSGSKEEAKKIPLWLEQPSELESFDVRKLETYANICLFTLYDLTKIIKVAQAVKPSTAYKYVKTRYKTLTLTTKQFSDTLQRKTNEDKFQRTADGLYYLTEFGKKSIKAIIGQEPH